MSPSFLTLAVSALIAMGNAAPVANQLEARGTGKRGLAYNVNAYTLLFKSNKVSWAYNWDSKPGKGLVDGVEYVPLLHGDKPVHTKDWAADVAAAVKAGSTHVMSFNEPDQCGEHSGGACMQDIGYTIAKHKEYVQPLAVQYPKLSIGAPAVTNGVKDEKTGKIMGLPFLRAFLAGCTGCKIDFISVHWYDSASNYIYFQNHINEAIGIAQKIGAKVWLTEFAPQGSDAEKQAFLAKALPWLDGLKDVERYAYQFVEKNILVDPSGKSLTPLGAKYINV